MADLLSNPHHIQVKKLKIPDYDHESVRADDTGDNKDSDADSLEQHMQKKRWWLHTKHFRITNNTGVQLHYRFSDDPNQTGALSQQKLAVGIQGSSTSGGFNISNERVWLPYIPHVWKSSVGSGTHPLGISGTFGALTVGFSITAQPGAQPGFGLRCDPEQVEGGYEYIFDVSDTSPQALTCGWVAGLVW